MCLERSADDSEPSASRSVVALPSSKPSMYRRASPPPEQTSAVGRNVVKKTSKNARGEESDFSPGLVRRMNQPLLLANYVVLVLPLMKNTISTLRKNKPLNVALRKSMLKNRLSKKQKKFSKDYLSTSVISMKLDLPTKR